MHYHPGDHIYFAQFREEFILLDTKEDKYVIYLKRCSALLTELFERDFSISAIKPDALDNSQITALINKFLKNHIVVEKDTPYPFYIDKKVTSIGVSNVDWRLPLNNKKIRFNLSVLHALLILIKVNFFMKVKGFHSAIQMVKASRKNHKEYSIPKEGDLENLANILNKACLIYPTRTKCLEWAMSFVLLALQRKWRCNLEIGVQNYPFFAHAWVECDGKVVMDSQELRQEMAVILNEPFRKLKH